MTEKPVALEVRDLRKSFKMRVPRESNAPRIRAKGYRSERVQVLDGISFDVHQAELFGIVGQNGSGKSTLLKLLSRIYAPDSGTIGVAGRLGPFVHLGVGFHGELTAWHNVCTNAVMMGLTPEEARDRFGSILEFAELEEYSGLELKNYSSGMRMRLAFATLLHVDADVLLIDEVLGVGDARFREKCAKAFASLRDRGKTIVMVSHSLGDIKRCDRALSLHEGKIGRIGDPREVTRHYLEIQRGRGQAGDSKPGVIKDARATGAPVIKITDAWLEDSVGRMAVRAPIDEELKLHALIEVGRATKEPSFACEVHYEDGTVMRSIDVKPLGGADRLLRPDDRVHVDISLGDQLAPGSYFAACQVLREGKNGKRVAMTEPKLLSFDVSKSGRTLAPPRAPDNDGLGAPQTEATTSL